MPKTSETVWSILLKFELDFIFNIIKNLCMFEPNPSLRS